MILSLKLERFIKLYFSGEKIHSLRRDQANRWRAGIALHIWHGNPRNKTKNFTPKCHAKTECHGVEHVIITRYPGSATGYKVSVSADGESWRWLNVGEMKELAINDGLSITEFSEWFLPKGVDQWSGKIVHWTSKRYFK